MADGSEHAVELDVEGQVDRAEGAVGNDAGPSNAEAARNADSYDEGDGVPPPPPPPPQGSKKKWLLLAAAGLAVALALGLGLGLGLTQNNQSDDEEGALDANRGSGAGPVGAEDAPTYAPTGETPVPTWDDDYGGAPASEATTTAGTSAATTTEAAEAGATTAGATEPPATEAAEQSWPEPTETPTTMKAATNPAKKAPSAARGKRCDRRVPLHEMHRLMTVYGPLKCQRRRSGQSAPSDVGALKKDSVKRKFYRWFPDLDERFLKDDAGVYVPRFGHVTEIRYRTEMRERDGKSLAKKRVQCRRQRSGEVATNMAQSASTDAAPVSPTSVPRACCFLSSDNNTTSADLAFDNHLLAQTSSSVLVSDAEPLDRSFLAEANIFDDVDMTFFGGPAVVDEIYSNGSNASSSWENDSSSIDQMLDRSLEECCEEILGSDDDASVSGYLLDMIST